MAKYTVTFKCGHDGTVNLFGKESERQSKIEWMGRTCKCEECKKLEALSMMKEEEPTEEVEMLYREYKTNYADCKTVSGSYNARNKTIIVLVPVRMATEA